MSDFPYVGPPPGGLTAAMTAARRRRLRTAGTTSGLSAMSLLVVALLVGQTGHANLVQGPTKETPAVTTDDRTAKQDRHTSTTVAVQDTRTFTAVAMVPGSAPASPAAAAPAAATDRGVAGPITREQTSPVPHSAPYAAGPIQRQENNISFTQCAVGGDGKSTTVCPESSYADSGPTTAPHHLSADVCSSDPNPVFLHYAGTSEVDFTVLDPKGKEVWRWSRWHPLGPTAHTLTLQTGYCTYWSFDWTGVDANGKPLPKGDGYSLRVRFHADELAQRKVADLPFSLT